MTELSSKPARSAHARELSFEQLLDSDEAAALLRIHPKTLQKMARNGEISGVQIGRVWRFRASIVPLYPLIEKSSGPQVIEKNGGDDGTRTRGLCRDRAAF